MLASTCAPSTLSASPSRRAEKRMIRPQLLQHSFLARERSAQHVEHAGRGIASEPYIEFHLRVVAHKCAPTWLSSRNTTNTHFSRRWGQSVGLQKDNGIK